MTSIDDVTSAADRWRISDIRSARDLFNRLRVLRSGAPKSGGSISTAVSAALDSLQSYRHSAYGGR
jgi:hypothetical protein